MMAIRAMEPDDVPQVCAVDAQCVPLPWSPETFQQELAGTVGYYRVAELDRRLVGYLGAHVVLDEAHIVTVGVDPAVRRRGIGERLLADALRYALYRKYGFSPISRRPRYYTDNGEDAIVMWIEDTTQPSFRALFEERLARLESNE
jgi:ribosomal-protein-alanine N-acetyltransferase